MRRRRGQLVLLAAAVVVTALVPMLLAYGQLTVGADAGSDAADTASERATLADATRSLERAVGNTTLALADGANADRHDIVAEQAVDRLDSPISTLESSGANRGVAISITRNDTAARRWARTDCPRGPSRAFDSCVVSDGVVTQTRANSTALVAVAVDISVRGPDGTARATVVIRGVRGAVTDRSGAAVRTDGLRGSVHTPSRRRAVAGAVADAIARG
jgi:hypothetical protein